MTISTKKTITGNDLPSNVLRAIKMIANDHGIQQYAMEIRELSGIGENSYGLVLQVKLVSSSSVEFSCVVKIAPANSARRQLMKVVEFYTREIFMYKKIFPEFEALRKDHFSDIVPDVYFSSLKTAKEFLIFEDLNQLDFKKNSRTKMPTYDLVAESLKALAKLHSMSFVLQAKKPKHFKELVSQITDNLFTESIEAVSIAFAKKYIQKTKSMLEERNNKENIELHSQQVDVVQEIEDNFKEITLNAVNGFKCAPYAVICHGDFWNNNILYQYDNENRKAIKAKLIDFQMSRYASPILDVVHYLFVCTEKSLRDVHFNEFLNIYYETLADELKSFELDPEMIYSKKVFQQQLKKFGVFGFCMAVFAIPFFISDSTELPDFDEVAEKIKCISTDKNLDRNTTTVEVNNNECQNADDTIHKNTQEFIDEYEMLTARSTPIFKERMIGIVEDLFKYQMVDYLLK